MKTAIIIHGMPDKQEFEDVNIDSPSNSHWIPWLKEQLEKSNISTETPEMPTPYDPDYANWLYIFKTLNLDRETILVGHSGGAGFLLRYISENDTKVGDVYLVAPWLDLEKSLTSNFFDFKLEQNIFDKVKSLNMVYSTDDDISILNSVKNIQDNIQNINVFRYEDKGHFTFGDMKTNEFPDLLNLILK